MTAACPQCGAAGELGLESIVVTPIGMLGGGEDQSPAEGSVAAGVGRQQPSWVRPAQPSDASPRSCPECGVIRVTSGVPSRFKRELQCVCPSCSQTLTPDQRVCPECGASVAELEFGVRARWRLGARHAGVTALRTVAVVLLVPLAVVLGSVVMNRGDRYPAGAVSCLAIAFLSLLLGAVILQLADWLRAATARTPARAIEWWIRRDAVAFGERSWPLWSLRRAWPARSDEGRPILRALIELRGTRMVLDLPFTTEGPLAEATCAELVRRGEPLEKTSPALPPPPPIPSTTPPRVPPTTLT